MARYHRVECDKCGNPIEEKETKYRVILSRNLEVAGVSIDLCKFCYEVTTLIELYNPEVRSGL